MLWKLGPTSVLRLLLSCVLNKIAVCPYLTMISFRVALLMVIALYQIASNDFWSQSWCCANAEQSTTTTEDEVKPENLVEIALHRVADVAERQLQERKILTKGDGGKKLFWRYKWLTLWHRRGARVEVTVIPLQLTMRFCAITYARSFYFRRPSSVRWFVLTTICTRTIQGFVPMHSGIPS